MMMMMMMFAAIGAVESHSVQTAANCALKTNMNPAVAALKGVFELQLEQHSHQLCCFLQAAGASPRL